jgi:hypothetical protein
VIYDTVREPIDPGPRPKVRIGARWHGVHKLHRDSDGTYFEVLPKMDAAAGVLQVALLAHQPPVRILNP